MARRPDPADWMWAQACEMLSQAERMHRQFFHLGAAERAQAAWQPPVDVLEDDQEVVIVVAMPGVDPQRIAVSSYPGVLVVSGERAAAFGGPRHLVRQLEIPYGRFERRIALPDGPLQLVSNEMIDGCLVLRLRKAG
ncbi:MAG TPA: Hsp20/alpha crystallin family protein [Usitatibacter sp.]|nr:Hsp20/alpha crystallin family protein [Usitatibacter sp.]